jgi:hypothetical protein
MEVGMPYVQKGEIEEVRGELCDPLSQVLHFPDPACSYVILYGIEGCGQVEGNVTDGMDKASQDHHPDRVEQEEEHQRVEMIGKNGRHQGDKGNGQADHAYPVEDQYDESLNPEDAAVRPDGTHITNVTKFALDHSK